MASKHFVFIRPDDCKGCGLCIDACPVSVLEFSKKLNVMGYRPAHYKGEGCTACGSCYYTCPEPGAITVIRNIEGLESAYCPHCKKEVKVIPDYRDSGTLTCIECLNPVNA